MAEQRAARARGETVIRIRFPYPLREVVVYSSPDCSPESRLERCDADPAPGGFSLDADGNFAINADTAVIEYETDGSEIKLRVGPFKPN